jgi:hypothetical protein
LIYSIVTFAFVGIVVAIPKYFVKLPI